MLLGRHQSQLPREQLRLMHPALCFNIDWSFPSPSCLIVGKNSNGGCQSLSITEQTYCMSICVPRRIRNTLLSTNYLLITVIYLFFFSRGMLESGRSGWFSRLWSWSLPCSLKSLTHFKMYFQTTQTKLQKERKTHCTLIICNFTYCFAASLTPVVDLCICVVYSNH